MIILIVAIIVSILIWFIAVSNKFAQTEVKIEEATSTIDIALEKRFDVIKQCYASAKNYMDHEHQTIVESVQYRKGMNPNELSKLNDDLNNSVAAINAVVESYPDLKANALFLNLQNIIVDTEDNLQASRRLCNSNVTIFNQMVVSFPTSIVANMKHYTKKDFFQATAGKAAGFDIPM